jgi:DNA-binding transcriptional regulator/RsmH inhibitor MraZ
MDRIEIWHPERWAEEQAVVSDRLEDFAAKLMGGNS